jgi:hypothetical protein
MKVRILSGNNAGAVVEMDVIEAQNAIATGYVQAVEDAPGHPAEPERSTVQPRHQSRADLRRQAREDRDEDETD